MSELGSLYRHSSHYLTGRVAVMVLALVSFPLFTRIFSVAEYGILSLVLKTAAMAAVVAKMALQNSVQRFYEESLLAGQLRRFYSSLFFGALLTSAGAAAAFLAVLSGLPDGWMSPSLRRPLAAASALVFLRGVQSIVMGFLRAEKRTQLYNVLEISTRALSIALICVILFAWDRSVHGFVVGTVVVEGVLVALVVWLLARRGLLRPRSFDMGFFRQAFVFGAPLIGYELAAMILDAGDRILLQVLMGAEAVGYYSAAYNISSFINESLMAPVSLAILPLYMGIWVKHGREETEHFLSRALDRYLLAAVWVVGVVTVTSRDALVVLASRKLQQAHTLLPLLVLGLVIYSLHMFLNAGLLIHKKTGVMLKIIAAAAAVNVALNLVLVPLLGLKGSALATVLSYALFVALLSLASLRLLRLRLDVPSALRYALAAVGASLLASEIETGRPVANVLVRSSVHLLVYLGMLYAIDPRARRVAADVRERWRQRNERIESPQPALVQPGARQK